MTRWSTDGRWRRLGTSCLQRGLGVEQRVLRVEVGRLRHGGVVCPALIAANSAGIAVIRDDEDVFRVRGRDQEALLLQQREGRARNTPPACM